MQISEATGAVRSDNNAVCGKAWPQVRSEYESAGTFTFNISMYHLTYVVGSVCFRPDQPFKVTEIKQLCYFSSQSPFISTHFSTDTLTSP